MSLSISPSDGSAKITIHATPPLTESTSQELATAVESTFHAGTTSIELWIHEVNDAIDRDARELGFVAFRDLWQLRCPLPAPLSTLSTRPFTSDDIDRFVDVNNRAFAWHPEQSGLTPASVRSTMDEPWFNPDGFRLYELDGELRGFCWTKIHGDHEPPLGEIYVIAIDPVAHGRGLGGPMTLAGLNWLAAQGLDVGMLYVESDNDPANATYRKLGFTHHHTDRAYQLRNPAAPASIETTT